MGRSAPSIIEAARAARDARRKLNARAIFLPSIFYEFSLGGGGGRRELVSEYIEFGPQVDQEGGGVCEL